MPFFREVTGNRNCSQYRSMNVATLARAWFDATISQAFHRLATVATTPKDRFDSIHSTVLRLTVSRRRTRVNPKTCACG